MPRPPEKRRKQVLRGAIAVAKRVAKKVKTKKLTRRTEKRRQQIFEDALAAAKKIAENEGLTGLTVRRIAKEIGCSVGTIYNVFDNLDTLILNLNAMTFDALFGELKNIEASDDAETTVRHVIDAYLKFVRENQNNWSVIFDHVWPQGYPLPQWYTDKIQRLLEPLADSMTPLFPSGQEDKIRQAAILLWSGLHGIQSLSSDSKLGFITSETAHDLSNSLVGIIVAGIRDQIGKIGSK